MTTPIRVPIRVRWSKGGEAEVTSFDGEAISLRSTVPSPPGSRIEGAMGGGGGGESEGEGVLRVKIHGSKRQEDGSFELKGRVLDLTKELRARLKGEG